MKTTLLILNWNTLPECKRHLQSLRDAGVNGVDVIVIDNASSQPGVDAIPDEFPGVELLKLTENLGFTGAFNIGVKKCLQRGAEVAVILNPDIIFVENVFPAIWEAFAGDPKLGVLCPAIYNDSECKELYCLGWNVESLSHPYRILKGLDKDMLYPTSVLGCFMAVRKEVFDRSVFFDERFYNYYEESDFCLRVRASGYQIGVMPQQKICHTRYAATGAYSPLKSYYLARNLVLFCRKHAQFGRVYYHIIRGFFDHWRQAKAAPETVRHKVRKALWEGLLDGCLGHFGRARRYLAVREKDYTIKGLE